MSIKEQLKEVYRLDRLIKRKNDELGELRASAVYSVPQPDPNGGSFGTSDPHSHENIMIKMVDLERYIEKLSAQLKDARSIAEKYIYSLKDERMQEMFSRRYLHFHGWKRIAEALDMTERGVFKMHGRGLLEIESNFK